MRCEICDYSQDTTSMFNEGLVMSSRYRPIVELTDGSCLCQLCYDAGYSIQDDDGDIELVEDDFDN